MHNFDSLTLKLFANENEAFINGAHLQKIQQPSRRELILVFRNLGETKKLYINIQPDFAHICFKNEGLPEIPRQAPMFCMLLRKHLVGARVCEFKNVCYERILEIYFDAYDEIGSKFKLCLAIELMGKHSNIVLYNAKTRVIVGCAHNISPEKSSVRELYGGINYIYPPKQNKNDILNSSYGGFFGVISEANSKEDLIELINKKYYYLSKPIIESVLNNFEGDFKQKPEKLFEAFQNLVDGKNLNAIFKHFEGENLLNESICSYFSKHLSNGDMKKLRLNLGKIAKKELSKINKFFNSKNRENKSETYRQKGEFILQNMHDLDAINENGIEIDPKISLSENAQKYFKLYQKEKTAREYQNNQNAQNLENKQYFEEILFQIENAASINNLVEIKEILCPENEHKKSVKTQIILENLTYKGWQIYVGKNSKQNDYLISKIAKSEDIWFHALNYPSGHIILKQKPDKTPPTAEILEFCAKLTKENSPLKNSGKASIIYTQKKHLKKPPCAKLGHVTYSNEKEIII